MSASKAPAISPILRNTPFAKTVAALPGPRQVRCKAALLLCLLVPQLNAQDFAELDAATGLAIFERIWVSAPSSTRSADGLGPYYNARSCAACHPKGAAGSAIDQLNFVIDDPVYGQLLQIRAVAGLPAEAHVVLSEDNAGSVRFADGHTVLLRKPRAAASVLRHGELQSPIAIRRAPALFGLAQLERVDIWQLQALADPDDANGDGISGRIAWLPAADGTLQPGRFGWKAAVATLERQIARALYLDLGLGSRLFPAAAGDCTAAQHECLQAVGTHDEQAEVPDLMLQLLQTYLAALPPLASAAALEESAGWHLFTEAGCAACHAARLATPAGELAPWTDLLLHDLGPGLADAEPSAHASAAEWRTAPLWGLGQLTRYLHDGRAASLEEAILWHDGEALASVQAYRQLNAAQRELLHAWLRSL